MDRPFFILGSILGGLGVILGAFGAHILKARVEAGLLEIFETGERYQMYHALALLVVAAIMTRWPTSGLLSVGGWLFLVGTILFSGSLYLLTVSGALWFGAITPIGGLAFVAGWICLAIAAFRR